MPEVKRKRGMPPGTIVREHETIQIIEQAISDGGFYSANRIAGLTGISWRTVTIVMTQRLIPAGAVRLIDVGHIKYYVAVNPSPGTKAQS